MTLPLSNKVALVTGASRGIGSAIARKLAADGAAVAITYSASPEKADQVVAAITKAGGKAIAIKADAADPEAVRKSVIDTVAKLGKLDILVNNAGVAAGGNFVELPLAEYDRIMNINVRGLFVASQEAAKHLPDGGRIINIGSCVSDRTPGPGSTIYVTSKAAVAGLTKALARDLGPRHITVNNVQPGPVDTDMNPANGPRAADARSMVPLGRYGTGEEIAALVAFVASPAASFITGAQILADGGFAT